MSGQRDPRRASLRAVVSELLATLRASGRIAADVAIYRLRKREAGNLVTSLTLAAALGLSPGDLASRAGFGALLNLFF